MPRILKLWNPFVCSILTQPLATQSQRGEGGVRGMPLNYIYALNKWISFFRVSLTWLPSWKMPVYCGSELST